MVTKVKPVQAYENEYKGLSTDTKPISCGVNSLFLELDTGDFYYFDGEKWAKIGASASGYLYENNALVLEPTGNTYGATITLTEGLEVGKTYTVICDGVEVSGEVFEDGGSLSFYEVIADGYDLAFDTIDEDPKVVVFYGILEGWAGDTVTVPLTIAAG